VVLAFVSRAAAAGFDEKEKDVWRKMGTDNDEEECRISPLFVFCISQTPISLPRALLTFTSGRQSVFLI
jgi:hypothetical protein